MNIKAACLIFFAAFLTFACSRPGKDLNETHLSGRITVDESLDNSGDYSGIELLVSYGQGEGETRDTLFYAETDRDGYFSGTATYETREIYPVFISRNQNTFGILNMVFADGDSIHIQAQLPNVNQTAEITSHENDLLQTFQRVERNFNRVAQYINAGAMSEDSVKIELKNWSDIYWQMHEENTGTFVSQLAGNMSVSLLRGWNDSLMIERAEKLIGPRNRLRSPGRTVMVDYYAEEEGLDRAISFLNRLENLSNGKNDIMAVQMDKIELLYDSSRTAEASEQLSRFRRMFEDNSLAMEWAENIGYDIEFLAPGSPFPDFSFVTVTGDSVTSRSMAGTPYLIEFTRFDNSLYQRQFDRTVAIYQIYNNFGLDIITVPVATGRVMVQAFLDEREMPWKLVEPNSFDTDGLVERFNINRVPTRFLVNDRGEIIRRYVGEEFQEVVRGLQNITISNE